MPQFPKLKKIKSVMMAPTSEKKEFDDREIREVIDKAKNKARNSKLTLLLNNLY